MADRAGRCSSDVVLVELPRQQGVHFEELIFPDEVHDFLIFEHWITATKAADSFFDRKVHQRALEFQAAVQHVPVIYEPDEACARRSERHGVNAAKPPAVRTE
jgi:hypothetical protein